MLKEIHNCRAASWRKELIRNLSTVARPLELFPMIMPSK
jgi:hypothetical protein